MCGISGQYCFGSSKPDIKLLSGMSDKLYHRGPDDYGTYIDDKVGLSHRRLSIIDLSKDGHQPMSNEDNSIQITYNGEIYNYLSIKDELIKKGHIFKSKTDTEIIIHSYEEWGYNCVKRFNGMWAFAIWDINKRILFCSRDRFGIKPFYYTFINGSFLFASEIKALLVHPDVGKIPDDDSIATFLAYGVQDHSYTTMFENIIQLQPSHNLIIDEKNDKIFNNIKYWGLNINPTLKQIPDKGAFTDDDLGWVLNKKLNDSIKIHLQSDVPVGTCLSGGIDSSTIVKFIKKENHHNQMVFSAVFPNDKKYNEGKYILDAVTNDMICFPTTPNPNDLLKNINNIIYMQDEPFGSLSIYAQYCVMRAASGNVKVLLDGQGADELMAGYIGYQYTYILTLLSQIHYFTAIKELYYSLKYNFNYYKYSKIQTKTRKERLKLLKILPKHKINRYIGELHMILYNDLLYFNLPAILHYEDRNSMAFSIESRVPYLDINVVKFISEMPYNQKIRNGISKFILRNATNGLIPDSIRNRTDKIGFTTPEEKWMKNDLKDFILNIITSDSFKNRKYWDAEKVYLDYLNYLSDKVPYSHSMWRIICTELWLRIYFDKR